MPPARLDFFVILIWPRVYLLAILVWATVCFLEILVKEKSNFSISCIRQKFGNSCYKKPTHCIFDVEISLAMGIIFRKLGLANGIILKLWEADPYLKCSRQPLVYPQNNRFFRYTMKRHMPKLSNTTDYISNFAQARFYPCQFSCHSN